MAHPQKPKRILVAPLDWGLGHATRCIPIINYLLQKKCEVLLAGEGKAQMLLMKEFPHLKFLPLRGYRVSYSKRAALLPIRIISQIPKILSAIRHEHLWLQAVVKNEKIDAVISDNRYGLHHTQVPTVFISHQLKIKAPALLEKTIQKINYRFINRFSECWVPDVAGENNLSGQLGHPQTFPVLPVHYIGALSRFSTHINEVETDNLLVLLSGPEPQRTIFENAIVQQLQNFPEAATLVRGLPGTNETLQASENVTVFNHLPANELEQKMRAAKLIISRCGYSTVMDLAALQKKSILIPTPGQTEQQYLAMHLMKRKFALCIPQDKFHLHTAIAMSDKFEYDLNNTSSQNLLSSTIDSFLSNI